jgi:four helix bundle protein
VKKAPNSKLQAPVKLQASRSKLDGGSTLQAEQKPSRAGEKYPEASSFSWLLNESEGRHPFDLEERTAVFGEAIIGFVKKIPRHPANDRLINQLVGCGTSIGANYCEANEGVSKKDFRNIVGRCVKEAKETKFFLRMIAAAEPKLAEEARALYREARELHLIFAAIYRKAG